MNGNIRFFDQLDNPLKSPLIRNRKRCMDREAKLCQAGNVCNVKIFKPGIVGDIEKD
jgi:hypothetical protein